MNFERLKISVRGAVQGVGFRPFIYRLATQLGLNGWVLNSAQGVLIEVEGVRELLMQFLVRMEKEKPARASIHSLESCVLDAVGYDRFEISASEQSGPKTVLVLPDIATCPDCLREILDPKDRRYRYPFTNCTNCGPRFTIVEALPYDRSNTSMKRLQCARIVTVSTVTRWIGDFMQNRSPAHDAVRISSYGTRVDLCWRKETTL
jgi:hydrogenase maturation protein HypF